MGKRVSALLALVMLAGCGVSPAPAGPEIPPEEPPAVSLPEFRQLEPISAPAVVTKGREPAGESQLPPAEAERQEYRQNMERWASGGGMELLAEAAGAAFYALPLYADSSGQTALIRWGDSRAEFDWYFATPRMYPPRMAAMDLDGDWDEELVVLTYTGSGTGVSIYDLHVLEKNPDGTLTDYAMPASLWQEQVPPLLRFVQTDGRNFLILGRELLEIDMDHVLEGDVKPSAGYIANFRLLPEENAIQLLGAVGLRNPTSYAAEYTADVDFRDGVFTLSQFHLQ